jgi:cytoskeletal protein CcmA (bactofilin family)
MRRTAAKTPKPQQDDTRIAADARIEGDIVFAGSIRIDGHVAGNVRAVDDQDHVVVIGKTGRVAGRVDAPDVVIEGAVDGDLVSRHSAELRAGARVSGDVHYRSLTMDVGAIVNGSLICEAGGAGARGLIRSPAMVRAWRRTTSRP